MARVSKAVSDAAAAVVAADPRGAPIVPAPTCILDRMPKNSLVVMLQWPGESAFPWLQTPGGKVDVPVGDLAYTLPLNGEVRKVGDTLYEGQQRDDPVGKPVLRGESAVDVIKQFRKHFHDARD